MAGDVIAQGSSKNADGLANDLINTLRSSNEQSRERLLAGTSQLNLPDTDEALGLADRQPVKWANDSLNPLRVNLQNELHAILDSQAFGGKRLAAASEAELSEVQARVNRGVFVKGLKLGPIEDAGRLTVMNSHGDVGHEKLTISLTSGEIYDESGTHYVSKNENGKIGFVEAEPVTVQSENGIIKSFNEQDDIFKIALPDGTTLTKKGMFDFSVNDSTGQKFGDAYDVVFSKDTLSFRRGSSLIAVDGNRLVEENLGSEQIRSKEANVPGDPQQILDPQQQALDRAILLRAVLAQKET